MPSKSSAAVPLTPYARVKIALPDELLTALEKVAVSTKSTVETVMVECLQRFGRHSDQKPLYFTDAERQRLEALIGKNVASAEDALTMLLRALSVRIDGAPVVLHPRLLARLKSRCFTSNFDKWLSQLICEELERYVGMR